ncbi:hypothetical protein JR316_0007988 [Psilocybe cubensis]|uniref:Uncharacterized protein n=2 Tax=Psilocybe cubensis TaxID=181762 RepID=A0ACB8GV51_PSICU|nr:hypothetical protein JR316_0007988 [Psilocybe cubensis]KAH9479398.1 hypothetical protein JR316_0007988 [Psilocybe cubensis]
MHPALSIDEILCRIFYFCSEYDQRSLLFAAQTCKAWTDPALDLLWRRLHSLGPLLLLLPGITISNDEYIYTDSGSTGDLRLFNSYARRVKHISNKQRLRINPSMTSRLRSAYTNGTQLSNLTTAHISIHKTNSFLLPYHISSKLSRLNIDIGFQRQEADIFAVLCEYLEHVHFLCDDLRHLSLRGLADKRLNEVIAGMQRLETISLRLGRTLSLETVTAIKTFPYLTELEIHAGHLAVDLSDEIYQANNLQSFPSLKKLTIRAQSPLIENLIQCVQNNTLNYLHIELEDSTSHSSWDTIFTSITLKASLTLHHLSLEHHYEIPEQPIFIASGATHSTQGTDPTDTSMRFDTLQILSKLKSLRHFTLDLTLPTITSDDVVDKIISWWPNLEHFELGLFSQVDDITNITNSVKISTAVLPLFASKCPKLNRLIIPLAIDEIPVLYPLPWIPLPSELRNLTIARLNTPDPIELGQFLRKLFPNLERLEGPCDDAQMWIDVNNRL